MSVHEVVEVVAQHRRRVWADRGVEYPSIAPILWALPNHDIAPGTQTTWADTIENQFEDFEAPLHELAWGRFRDGR